MLKIKLFFCAISRNRFFNQFISVTKTNLTGIAGKANRVISRYKNMLRNASQPLAKMFAVAGFSFFIHSNATAQCNTFHNADAANPLLNVLPKGKTIAGFAFADIDGDGKQDVYVDYLGDRNADWDVLHLYKNVGTKKHPVFKEDTNTGFGKYLAGGQNGEMQFVDIDGDGDLDYFVSDSTYYYYGSANIFYYKNVGTTQAPTFIPSVADFLPKYLGTHYIQPFTFADVDGDGDYDLYASDTGPYDLYSYNQRVYFNIGTAQNPVFDGGIVYNKDGDLYRTYYDWNKDGLLDFFDVIKYWGSASHVYYQNTGQIGNPQYIFDNKSGPLFLNGEPYRMIDLNNDGAPEVFDFNAHYSTLAPVAVIQDTVVNNGNKQITILSSQSRSANFNYRWEYNGKTIPGATLSYIYATKPGVYTLYVTDDCGIGVSLNDTLTQSGVQLEQANDRLTTLTNMTASPVVVKSYPNPFTNTFTLQLSASDERTESMVKITDLAGRIFLSQRMSAPSVQLGQRLPAGIYSIQVWQQGELVYHTITMKQ